MSSLLKAIDIFGTKFHFTINQKRNYNTTFGGILTVISFAIFIVLLLYIGKDSFYQNNPIASTTIFFSNKSPKANFSSYNITIAIKLEKQGIDNESIDLTGGFFWSDLTQSSSNKESSIDEDIPYFTFKKCQELSYQPSYNFSNDYYCVEFPKSFILQPDITFEYSIYNCEQKLPHGHPYPYKECNSIQKLKETFMNLNSLQYLLTIYYPVFYYDPNSKDNSATLHYEMLSFPFDYNLQRSDILKVSNSIINEDFGWFYEIAYNSTYFGVDSHDYSLQYKSDDDLQIPLSSSKVYQLNIEMSHKKYLHRKSYMKIQQILAIVAVILKMLIVIFDKITFMINCTLINFFAFNKFFETNEIPSDLMNHSIINHHQNVSNIGLNNLVRYSINNSNVDKKKKPYSYCFAIRRSISKLIMPPSSKKIVEKYDIGHKVVKSKIDLNNYIKMIYDILILQCTVFNTTEFNDLNLLKNVNLNNKTEMDTFFLITTNKKKEISIKDFTQHKRNNQSLYR